MLTELRISNFAVIERLELECAPGFHVLTGETGAGKSIIIDAIALLLGGRASGDQIRAGASEAVLEAAFQLPPESPLVERLRAEGLLDGQASELFVRRVLSRSGRNRFYLNGTLAPLHVVQSLAGTVIDIHGQHDQQSLLASQAQLDALDAFGRLRALRRAYGAQYRRWRESERTLEEAERAARERAQREEFLRFQSQELAEADPRPGEEAALEAERSRLAHAGRLGELRAAAYEAIYGDEGAVVTRLGAAADRLGEMGRLDPQAAELADLCAGALVQARELAQRLRDYERAIEPDPERLERIEARLQRLERLKKKYGGSLEALLAKAEEVGRELEQLQEDGDRVAALRAAAADERSKVEAMAARLTEGRVKAAGRMQARVQEELAGLRMEHIRFRVEVSQEPEGADPGPTGRDRAAFLFSANPGEPLQPLARVASGGELSRVMLAIKTVMAETDGVPVLIFDEVDAGVGGAVAAVMGRRLRALAQYHQVFCVTHLPQIASQAGTHLLVEKTVSRKRAVTRVRRLDRAAREEELARMLGGLAVTRRVRETAAEMLREAEGTG
jgi:DNA repair protein RecN (Recombination protein N)